MQVTAAKFTLTWHALLHASALCAGALAAGGESEHRWRAGNSNRMADLLSGSATPGRQFLTPADGRHFLTGKQGSGASASTFDPNWDEKSIQQEGEYHDDFVADDANANSWADVEKRIEKAEQEVEKEEKEFEAVKDKTQKVDEEHKEQSKKLAKAEEDHAEAAEKTREERKEFKDAQANLDDAEAMVVEHKADLMMKEGQHKDANLNLKEAIQDLEEAEADLAKAKAAAQEPQQSSSPLSSAASVLVALLAFLQLLSS